MSDRYMEVTDLCRNAAQQAVTALLAGDRSRAGGILLSAQADDETGHVELMLPLVLADFAAYIHHRWAKAFIVDRDLAWQALMTDVEAWREARSEP